MLELAGRQVTPPARPEDRPLRVALVDRRSLLRSGLRALLEQQPDIRVVAEVAGVTDLAAVAPRARPDVALTHLDAADGDRPGGVAAFLRASAAMPHRLVVYATARGADHVELALRHGVRGFLRAADPPVLMVEAVRAAAAGDVLVSPALITGLLPRLPATPHRVGAGRLTARETELVHAVALGLTNAEPSTRIHMSLSTVKHCLTTVRQKLHLRNRVEIATWAWRSGLISEMAGDAPGTPHRSAS